MNKINNISVTIWDWVHKKRIPVPFIHNDYKVIIKPTLFHRALMIIDNCVQIRYTAINE